MQNKIVQGAPPDSSGKPMSRRSEQLLPGRTPINENVKDECEYNLNQSRKI